MSSFSYDEETGNVFLHSDTLERELVFELEPSEDAWKFSDVEYKDDYDNYSDEYDKYY